MEDLILVLEIIGTIAFALSGVFVAIENELDVFGIIVLAISTATGGGIMRDCIIGRIPPVSLVNPLYGLLSIGSAIIAIVLYHSFKKRMDERAKKFYFWTITVSDAIGLGFFTVLSSEVALSLENSSWYLVIFVSLIAAVGGGILRDVLVNKKPTVLRSEVYAMLSICGSALYIFVSKLIPPQIALLSVGLLIALARVVAVKRHLNLPRVASLDKIGFNDDEDVK